MMNPDEQALADRFYDAIQDKSNYSERSQQSADFRIGMSDLGWCSEKVRRMLDGNPEPITDKLPAFIGTALGDHIEQAWVEKYPDAIRQASVEVVLEGDHGTYTVGGHPDLILPEEGIVVDVKTKRGLSIVERSGPDRQQQFQRHGYAKGAWTSGLFRKELALGDVRVANVWLDRAGDERRCHVQMEPFDPGQIDQAGAWVDDVVYAYLHGEPAEKEPPRDMCAKVCGHFATCRAMDTDVEGLITDPETITAVEVYREGLELEAEGRRLKDQAKAHLRGWSGNTDKFSLRWTWVNEALVPETVRSGYYRLDLKRMR